ncbi:MAG: ykuD [Chthoniobacteraceae bacterium]|nr:ykuD [Chthoniobacteraceae bacterium]
MVKAFIILLLAIGVFGSAAYWTYELFLRPHQELKEEQAMPPEPPPPDPSLPEFEKCLLIQKGKDLFEARTAFEHFIEQNPQSSKLEDARDRLGGINSTIFLSPMRAPEKEEYVVKSGDVLNKVAGRLKTTPELIMRSNRLSSTMLRIGQKLIVPTGEFSMNINKRSKLVTLFNRGKFFKQYPIRTMPVPHAVPARKGASAVPPVKKLAGKVSEKIAWAAAGQRVTFAEKEYESAAHWIVSNVPGSTLYSDPDPESGLKPHKPPTGLGLAPEHMEELAALLRKGDPVTIEQ